MISGTKLASVLATFTVCALPCAAQEAVGDETKFPGYVSTEVTFLVTEEEVADRQSLVELSAQVNARGPALDEFKFNDVYPPLTEETDRFSLIVSVDAGRGETISSIASQVDHFVASIPQSNSGAPSIMQMLDERSRAIFREVVETYLETGEPVKFRFRPLRSETSWRIWRSWDFSIHRTYPLADCPHMPVFAYL